MKELVEFIARSIVSHPDEVSVSEEEDDDGRIVVLLEVAPEDKGKVIGRRGSVAQSMRALVRVAAAKQRVRATLEIV